MYHPQLGMEFRWTKLRPILDAAQLWPWLPAARAGAVFRSSWPWPRGVAANLSPAHADCGTAGGAV